jgi:CelD/BcsL family acetyltransferase involved in cellulose biosynthesis
MSDAFVIESAQRADLILKRPVRDAAFTTTLLRRPDDAWRNAERELASMGLPLQLFARTESASQGGRETWLLVVRNEHGRTCGAVALHVRRVRELPGHCIVQVDRFASSIAPDALDSAAQALAALLRRDHRVLRMDLDVFSRDESIRQKAAAALEAAGFQSCRSSSYVHTLVVDLTPTEEQIFASFRSSARRNVRQLEKHPLEIRSIDHSYIGRLEQLTIETLRRTDGTYVPQDWSARIALSQSHPHLSRISGVFRTDREGPEALLSFMWGAMHGDHGQYRDGASTRGESRVPVSYALMWDLVRWAKQQGAHWFDLGGVTDGHEGDTIDLLGGISDFKRHFTARTERVGDGWVLNAMTLRARVARGLVQVRSRMRSWR